MSGIDEHIADLTGNEPEEPGASLELVDDPGVSDPEPVDSGLEAFLSDGDPDPEASPSSAPGSASGDESEWPEGFVPRTVYDIARQESDGRLGEITNLRQAQRQTNEAIEALRVEMLNKLEPEAPNQDVLDLAEFGPEVLENPAVRYLKGKLEGLEQRIAKTDQELEAEAQAERQAEAAAAETRELTTWLQSDLDHFRRNVPQYDAAYAHARQMRAAMYPGLTPQQLNQVLNQEELQLAYNARMQGKSPSRMVWDIAISTGFDPKSVKIDPNAQAVPNPTIVNPARPSVDVSKISAGLDISNPANLVPSPSSNNGEISIEAFYKLPAAERRKVLTDPGKFRSLAKRGKVKL